MMIIKFFIIIFLTISGFSTIINVLFNTGICETEDHVEINWKLPVMDFILIMMLFLWIFKL